MIDGIEMPLFSNNERKNGIEIPLKDAIKSAAGRDVSVYLVGGSLRNIQMGLQPYDWDFIVDTDAGEFAKTIARSTRSAFVPLDEENGIYRVVPKKPGNLFLDVSTIRGGLEDDLTMRDFTINAMAYDIAEEKIVDPLNGAEDIKRRRIRVCSGNSITDDPLRILRAYRFKANLGFNIAKETKNMMIAGLPLLHSVASERKRDEIYRTLKASKSCGVIVEMFKDGVLQRLFPEIVPMEGLTQNDFHKFDVLGHSFETLLQLESIANEDFAALGEVAEKMRKYCDETIAGDRRRIETIKLAALLHDVGKPVSRRIEDDILYYIGHHEVGKKIWLDIADRSKLSKKEASLGAEMIYHHLAPVFLPQIIDEQKRKTAAYRFFRESGDAAPAVMLLSWADVEAGQGRSLTKKMIKAHHEYSIWLVQQFFNKTPIAFPPDYIDGRGIMDLLKIKPGKRVGEIITGLREKTAIGEITDRCRAVEYVKSFTPPADVKETED